MPRGGKRSGTAGKSYPNRTDMFTTSSTSTYGDKAAAQKAVKAMPLAVAPSPAGKPAPAPAAAPAQAGGAPMMMAAGTPDQVPGDMPFNRPTDCPNEPLTAGMPTGPGVGPSSVMPSVDPVADTLRAAARMFPNSAIFSLLEDVNRR